MKDVVADALEARTTYERKRDEAIAFLLERRRELVKEIDEQLKRLGYDPESGTSAERREPVAKARATRGPRQCSNCGQVGHTVRSCSAPTLAPSATRSQPRLIKRAGGGETGGA